MTVHGCTVRSPDWLPNYIKAKRPFIEIYKMAGYIYIYIHKHAHIKMYVCMYVYVYIYINVCICIYIYMHTYILETYIKMRGEEFVGKEISKHT